MTLFGIFLTVTMFGLAAGIWIDATEKNWRKLSASYATDIARNGDFHLHTVYLWSDDDKRKYWINGIYIACQPDALKLSPAWIRRLYTKPVDIPWQDLRRANKNHTRFGRVVLELPKLRLFLAIPKKVTMSSEFPL